MKPLHVLATAALILAFLTSTASALQGNAANGHRAFAACAPCHSLEPNKNMTGPTLAHLWGRKAGTLKSFDRYSPALKSSNLIWNDKTLNDWIKDPQNVIPDNQMPFPGIKNAQTRADLLAFLKQATEQEPTAAQNSGGMGGMMGGSHTPSLKKLDTNERVQAITYCKDTYTVKTADGQTRKFWDRNLRFKTDASSDGPEKNAPAIVGAGMMGDRADIIFANPDEISRAITDKCK